ncbi:MAG: DciA family protein [Candidatus Omnitrophota bacterium]
MELLKNTLEEVMRQLGAKKSVFLETGPQQWLKKVLTKKELGHIRVKYFHKGILGLSVDSSAWLYILSLKKEELLAALKKENPELKNINFRIGEIV